MKKRGFISKTIALSIVTLVIVAAIIFYYKYTSFFGKNVPDTLQEKYILIPSGSSFQDVVNLLYEKQFIIDSSSFTKTAKRMNYKKNKMRSGKFEIQPGWSNMKLIRHLRNGKQTPVTVIFNNERLIKDVAGKAARFIETDSITLFTFLNDENNIKKHGYTKETLMTLFIPNSYEFFWNTSPEKFLERMVKEHEKFWKKDNRKEKARKLNLTEKEVYTLASIIEKETNQNSEKRRMAGVYLNRLSKGMLLQADPTCVFASGDFETTRVTNYHLNFDSPYNTYLYIGLPPGPIAMASIASIDAVLNREDHDFIFFCAKGDGSGLHAFAKTLSGHNQNVKRYKRNLRKNRR